MNEKEYLELFNKIKNKKEEYKSLNNKNDNDLPSLNETPNYNDLPKLNETPSNNYNINENLNDGWNIDFQFETRVNGVKQSSDPYKQQKRRTNEEKQENLNEVLRERNNQIYNEKVDLDNDVVSLEQFNQMRRNSMMSIVNRIIK